MVTRRPVIMEEHDHRGAEGDPYDGVLDLPPGHSCMVLPLFAQERSLGLITLDKASCGHYDDHVLELCSVVTQLVSAALVFAEQTEQLAAMQRVLEERNRILREELTSFDLACRRLSESASAPMLEVVRMAKQVAVTDAPVLIHGETGTGKEVLAQAIHAWSNRAGAPMVKLNCAAMPEQLVESELFGHVKGAFSGAVSHRPGRLVAANGGTLFLDEIGDMPLAAQGKLLRALQEKTFEPVGSDKSVHVDVRVIAASHVDLQEAIERRTFREDLYYRLAVFPLELPPLRERTEDLLGLCTSYLTELSLRSGRGPWMLEPDTVRRLKDNLWPGNVRQLVNALERATILVPSGALSPEHLGLGAKARGRREAQVDPGEILPLREQEKRMLEAALARAGGKIYGADGAAKALGLPPSTLQSKLRKLGLR
jgi:transcriptional regulator with GAF, ATPase, and Fis domain